jgi:predicted nucleic acid-binding protein
MEFESDTREVLLRLVCGLGYKTDNRILECAATGGAELILTGDQAMLDLRSFEGIQIASLRAYLET